jgi:hypothetical protein
MLESCGKQADVRTPWCENKGEQREYAGDADYYEGSEVHVPLSGQEAKNDRVRGEQTASRKREDT